MGKKRMIWMQVTSCLLILVLILPMAVGDEVDEVGTLNLLWENSEGHNATLWSVSWSPDGSMISATYFDNTTTIFQASNGEMIVKLGSHPEKRGTRCDGEKDCLIEDHLPTRTSAWSPDGRYLATGGDNRLIVIYDTTDWEIFKILEGHQGSILTLAWSSGGTMLASGSGTDKVDMHNNQENLIKIWEFPSGNMIADLAGHKDGVLNVKWSPDGSQIASASDDKTIMLWDTKSWNRTLTLLGHTLGVLDVDWSPDGNTLVSGSRDYKVRTWDAKTGEALERWTEPNCVRSVAYHPSLNLFANSGVDETMLKIRNASSGTILKSFTESADSKSVVMSSRWSPDGSMLAAGAGKEHTLRVYAFGIAKEKEKETVPKWLPGTLLFVAIAVSGIIMIIFPIRKKLRESGR